MAPSSSSHKKGSRDSMTPSVTSGAMTGAAACKTHAKPARGSSIIMAFPPKEFSRAARRGDLPKPLINDRQNGANIPEGTRLAKL
jgi:hypothetical protein